MEVCSQCDFPAFCVNIRRCFRAGLEDNEEQMAGVLKDFDDDEINDGPELAEKPYFDHESIPLDNRHIDLIKHALNE